MKNTDVLLVTVDIVSGELDGIDRFGSVTEARNYAMEQARKQKNDAFPGSEYRIGETTKPKYRSKESERKYAELDQFKGYSVFLGNDIGELQYMWLICPLDMAAEH